MKEKELFDMLENAEDAQVEELAESCPELTEAQLGRLLAKSEKKCTISIKNGAPGG